VYFGPMGCRTGFYLIRAGNVTSEEAFPLVKRMMEFIAAYEGEIPGASAVQCGNYLDLNLPMAKWHAKKYIAEVMGEMQPERLHYPE